VAHFLLDGPVLGSKGGGRAATTTSNINREEGQHGRGQHMFFCSYSYSMIPGIYSHLKQL